MIIDFCSILPQYVLVTFILKLNISKVDICKLNFAIY